MTALLKNLKDALRSRAFLNLRTFSTLVGVILGVSALTASFNFCEAARRAILKGIEGMTSSIVVVKNRISQDAPAAGRSSESNALLQARERLSPDSEHRTPDPLLAGNEADVLIRSIAEFAMGTPASRDAFTSLTPRARNRTLSLWGVNPEFSQIMRLQVVQGRFFYPFEAFSRKRVCVLTEDVAKDLFGGENACGKSVFLHDAELQVLGVVSVMENTPFIDASGGVFAPYETFLQLTGRPDVPDLLIMKMKRGADGRLAAAKIDNVLMRNRSHKNYQVWDQRSFMDKKKQMVSTLEWLVTSVSMLILLVAGISCSNIMVLSINQRRQEIGIRRAVGATKADIMGLFLWEGFLLICAGGALGLAGGFFLTQEILKPLPGLISAYSGWEFRFAAGAASRALSVLFLMAFLSSLVPAWHAARLDPVQALRRA